MRLDLFRILFSLGIVVYLLSPQLQIAQAQQKETATSTDGTEYVIDNKAEDDIVVTIVDPTGKKVAEIYFSYGNRVEGKTYIRNENGELVSIQESTFDEETGNVTRVTTTTRSENAGDGWSSQTTSYSYHENGGIKKARRYSNSNNPSEGGDSQRGAVEYNRDGEVVKTEGNTEGITDDLSLNDNKVHIMIDDATGMIVIIKHTPEGRIDITRIINGAIVEQSTFTCPDFGDCPISQTEASFLDEMASQDEPIVYGIRIRQERLLAPGMGSGDGHGGDGGHY